MPPSEPSVYGPVERERVRARETLLVIRERLRDRTATSEDHRPAIEAVLTLPAAEAEGWLEEIRTSFILVYAREREERERARNSRAPHAS